MTSDAFPAGFLWGAATSAYQIEGAAASGGRGPSIWDVFCHMPGKVADGHTADVACDHYHRLAEDVELMRTLNLGAYRFSVSWPRILPEGRGAVNSIGLDFYDRLVDALRGADIEPFVTLYHWDLPAALQFELGGWLHPDLPELFADYAALLYDRLADRVRFWITINEPWCIVDGGYLAGVMAPGSKNRAWAYEAAHNLLRAHAYAVACYRSSPHGEGSITFALNMPYSDPASDSPADRDAAERALLDFGGWFADPAYCGDYPAVMRENLGELLPQFTPQDRHLLKGSMDYLALNYYLSDVVEHVAGDGELEYRRLEPSGRPSTAMGWPIVPQGLRKLLHWLTARYPRLPIYITENGACFDDQPGENGFVDDQDRIAFLKDHIAAVRGAMKEGVDVRGFLVWTLLDNFEWSHGYHKRFGLVRCDFQTLRRTVKASGRWYAEFIAGNRLDGRELALPRHRSSGA